MEELARTLQERLRSSLGEPELVVASLEPFGDGHSGFTYLARIDPPGGLWVLRTSPPGVRIAGPADVGRQGRIMQALFVAGLPAPAVLDYSSEPKLDGRSFALTALVAGTGWEEAARELSHRRVAETTVGALRSLQDLAPKDTGLHGETPTSLEDDLRRWGALLERAPEFLHEPGAELLHRLAEATPGPVEPSLVHGDFHYGNVLYAQGEVAAIIDWEIASLGDPRLDLGCLGVASLRRKYPAEPNSTGSVEVGFGELTAMYGEPRGELDWFLAEACLKYAAILGYNYNLHRSGRRPDPLYEQQLGTMRGLLDDGLAALDGRPDFA